VARSLQSDVEVSVVIVNWNAGHCLQDCLHSLTGNTKRRVEIILVDNGSTDGSPEAAQRAFPDVDIIHTGSNLGFAAANNIGIRKSSGRFVCLINPDVVVHAGCLDRMADYMEQHPSVGMLGPKVLNTDLTLQLSCWRFPSLWSSACRAVALDAVFPRSLIFGDVLMTSWAHDAIRPVDVLSGCFWMIREETLASVGLLDEDFFMYGEDVDYCRRCWDRGMQIVYHPLATVVHHGGASSSHAPVRFQVENLKGTLRYWRKHHTRRAVNVFSAISLVHQFRRFLQGLAGYMFVTAKRNGCLTQIRASIACGMELVHLTRS
jgi:GT2 family glycosyltransferase